MMEYTLDSLCHFYTQKLYSKTGVKKNYCGISKVYLLKWVILLPRYYSDDDEPSRRPGIVDNPSDREFDEYIADFSTFIHYTKCSLCNKQGPCLPIHLPFYRQQIFICAACVYGIHEHLAAFGYFQQLMDEDIRTGKVREQGGAETSVNYVNAEPISSVQQDDDEKVPLHVDDDIIEEFELNPLLVDHEDPGPRYEADRLAVDFSTFSQDTPLFSDPPQKSVSCFATEVIMRRKCFPNGSCDWVDYVPANDPQQKERLFEEYISGQNLSRLFRVYYEFYLCFHNWVDGSDSFEQIQTQLEDQLDAIKKVIHWHTQGKIKVHNTDSSPSILYFHSTADIFHEVMDHPSISFYIDDTEIITLARGSTQSC